MNSNTPIEGLWLTISVIQMESYLTLIEIEYPQNLLIFLRCVETVHNFNKWFPNPFTYFIEQKKLNMGSYNTQFNDRGITNRNMLFLCGSDIALMGLTLFIIIVLSCLENKITYFL